MIEVCSTFLAVLAVVSVAMLFISESLQPGLHGGMPIRHFQKPDAQIWRVPTFTKAPTPKPADYSSRPIAETVHALQSSSLLETGVQEDQKQLLSAASSDLLPVAQPDSTSQPDVLAITASDLRVCPDSLLFLWPTRMCDVNTPQELQGPQASTAARHTDTTGTSTAVLLYYSFSISDRYAAVNNNGRAPTLAVQLARPLKVTTKHRLAPLLTAAPQLEICLPSDSLTQSGSDSGPNASMLHTTSGFSKSAAASAQVYYHHSGMSHSHL